MNIKVPVSWLREYLKTDVNAKTIANYLTLSGPSVERIETHGDDYIFDVEVTTNRSDAFSIFGLAREANTILNSENQKSALIEPKGLSLNLEPDTNHKLPLEIIIKNQSLCPRFTAIVIDNVKIKPSPAYIRNRLQASGIRAINNIVDISNYVMLELGQPMHTFDYDKIKGSKMTLRESTVSEKLQTIDDQVRKLPAGTIVIEDSQKIIDLCGIMGGANSQISSRTKRVVIFVQAYDPIRIRKATQALSFRTEAAARFEKGIDLEGILPALKRAVYLAKETSDAKIASELIDIYKDLPQPQKINLNLNRLKNYLGVNIESAKVEKILTLLGFKTTVTSQIITSTPPSWRVIDVVQEEDLIEEVARIYGYHKLPQTLPTGQIPNRIESDLTKVIELKKALKYLGLTEIISYSIISRDFLSQTQIPQKDAVELQNPLTEEWQFMRPTLLVSLAAIIAQNQNVKSDLSLFEIAKTYISPPSSSSPSLSSSSRMRGSNLPKQDLVLSATIQNGDFPQIKGLVENIFEILNHQAQFVKSKTNALFDKNQQAQIKIGKTTVGTVGILNPKITDHFEIENEVAACELNLTTIYNLLASPAQRGEPFTIHHYKPISKYPPVIEDLSAIFDEKTPIDQILTKVEAAGTPLLKTAAIIDVFRSEKIGQDKKSITLRLTYQKNSGTLQKEEVDQVRDKIMDTLIKSLGARVRVKLSPI